MRTSTTPNHRPERIGFTSLACLIATMPILQAFDDPEADLDRLPEVPPGFVIELFAKEPLVRNPCSMAFDVRGRMFVGMGPQYRKPRLNTPPDSVFILQDKDGDGVAEERKEFATGFNNIQALAWHGGDLWVANAPDLTIVRDLDGDDRADEYVRVYTDLGNIEHGLHGLNWAPDGRLYMSKGNSKGLSVPGRIAPKPFRDLWGVEAPDGSPDFPPSQKFAAADYRPTYHDPDDDWGREGGVLRCDDLGRNLEIVSRGLRNPWDITHDDQFNWLGTDNDQSEGDRIFSQFAGAHFGWSHAWSSSWSGNDHPPTAPINGPTFQGSGTGVIWYDEPQFPEAYRGVFFVNDWLQKNILVYRPTWNGGTMMPEGGGYETFVQGGPALFRPTDIEVGPDGALYCLGWGRKYGVVWNDDEMANEGRVFRIRWTEALPRIDTVNRNAPVSSRPFEHLITDLGSPIPARRIDAQDEIVRRGSDTIAMLISTLESPAITTRQRTWLQWAIGRIKPNDDTITVNFERMATDESAKEADRIQAIRILADRHDRSGDSAALNRTVEPLLTTPLPRIRFESFLAIRKADSPPERIIEALGRETDRLAFYAGWQTLATRSDTDSLLALLQLEKPRVRLAALLALLDDDALDRSTVERISNDAYAEVRSIANLWLDKTGSGVPQAIVKGRPLQMTPSQLNEEAVTPAAVRDAMANADASRGARLYRESGCANCHRVGTTGNSVAPDLTSIGTRAGLAHVIESILDPNAAITEGYSTVVIETLDTGYSGVLLEETDHLVELALANGDQMRIPKSSIIDRETIPVSAMPSFAWTLAAQDIADIASWLIASSGGPTKKFKGQLEDDRLVITNDGNPVAHFVFRDEETLRPYIAHVHTPDGTQITRNHPPIEGVDRTDHATMHPGIWLAFGDVNGLDFWRNKATIRHERFLAEPGLDADDRFTFATESSFLNEAAQPFATLTSAITFELINEGYLLTWDAAIDTSDGPVVFGDQEEMGFGVRVATPITERAGGTILSADGSSHGRRDMGQGVRLVRLLGSHRRQTRRHQRHGPSAQLPPQLVSQSRLRPHARESIRAKPRSPRVRKAASSSNPASS